MSVDVNKLMDEGSEFLTKGKFEEAIASFDKVRQADPSKEPLLWQRGIALFFQGSYAEGIKQFEKDMISNGRDAEETIWRFLCAAAATSVEQARQEFVQPAKGDSRTPMAQILEFYQGTGTEEAILTAAEAGLGAQRENQLFYAHYYIGAFLEVSGSSTKGLERIRTALKYKTADYMGKVAKVHELNLARKLGMKRASIPSLSLFPATQVRTTLSDGYSFSKIIRGCWQLSKGHQLKGETTAIDTIIEDFAKFQDKGITTSDCGDIYTGVEETLGKCIRSYRDAAELNDRETYIQVHSKLVPDEDALQKVDLNYCRQVVLRSLNRLGVDRLDLLQLHWWNFGISGYIQAAKHLVTLQREDLIRHIGVTNFDTVHLKELIDAGVPVVTNQVQYSLLDRRAAAELTKLCVEKQIRLLAYGVLAGGFLTDRWIDQPEPESNSLSNRSLIKYKLIIDDAGGWVPFQTLLKTLRSIADKHSTTIAAIAIRWVLDQPQVGAVIFGGRDSSHLDGILPTALQMKLTTEDINAISSVLSNLKPLSGDVYSFERDKAGPHGKIMKYNLNRVSEPDHFDEVILRYVELMHRLHPERASEQGLRSYDALLPQTSARGVERIAILLSRTIEELDGMFVEQLDKNQLADLAAVRVDANLRLFRIRRLHDAQLDPFFYLSPGYRGIRYMANMIGRIPRAEASLLSRLRKFVAGLRDGVENLDAPPTYLATSAIRYIEGLSIFFESIRQKFQRNYEEHLLDETSRQIAAVAAEAISNLALFSQAVQSKAVEAVGMGREAYIELVRDHLRHGLTVEDLLKQAEALQTSAKHELQAIIMANRASSPPTGASSPPPQRNAHAKSFSIGKRRPSVATSSDTTSSPSSPGPSSPNMENTRDYLSVSPTNSPTQQREHGRSFSFTTHTRSFSFGRRRSSTAQTTEINHLGQLPSDAEAEKLYKDVSTRTKTFLTGPTGLFSTLAKLASLIDEEAAILNNIGNSLPDYLSPSLLRSYHSGDIAVLAIHDTLREFLQLAIRINSGPRLFAEQGFPSLLSEGFVLFLAEVLIRDNFFADYEYQRQRTIHRRSVLATRAILEIKLHSGIISPEDFKNELVNTCEVPERPAEDMVRQAIREPTVAASAVLGYNLLREREQTYGTGVANLRKFLDYVFAGDGMCVELTSKIPGK